MTLAEDFHGVVDPLALSQRDRLEGGHEVGPGLDLDCHQLATAAGDQIDLACTYPEAAGEDAIALDS